MERTSNKVCNKCGKEFKKINGIYHEDFIEINKDWGFFSRKDGKTYSFAICEDCSEAIIKTFSVPIDMVDTIELV